MYLDCSNNLLIIIIFSIKIFVWMHVKICLMFRNLGIQIVFSNDLGLKDFKWWLLC